MDFIRTFASSVLSRAKSLIWRPQPIVQHEDFTSTKYNYELPTHPQGSNRGGIINKTLKRFKFKTTRFDTEKYGGGVNQTDFIIDNYSKRNFENEDYEDFASALHATKDTTISIITKRLAEVRSKNPNYALRVVINATGQFVNNAESTTKDAFMSDKGFFVTHPNEILSQVNKNYANLINIQQNTSNKGSGWSFEFMKNLKVDTYMVNLPPGKGFIDEFKNLHKKGGLLIINTPDELCVKDVLEAHNNPEISNTHNLQGKRNRHRTDYKQYRELHTIDYNGIDPSEFPPKPTSDFFDKIELNNNKHIIILGADSAFKNIYTIRRVKHKSTDSQQLIVLVYIVSESGNQAHYALVTNLDSFMYTNSTNKCKFTCPSCLRRYTNKELLDAHTENGCDDVIEIRFPEQGSKHSKVKFKSYAAKYLTSEFIVYDSEARTNTEERKKKQVTYQKTKAFTCGRIKRKFKTLDYFEQDFKRYTGEDAASQFIEYLVDVMAEKSYNYQVKRSQKIAEIQMTPETIESYKNATKCCHCWDIFYTGSDRQKLRLYQKVRDHNHKDGSYIGASHAICNLLRDRKNQKIPVIAHNMMGYDIKDLFHALVKYMDENPEAPTPEILPKSEERFIALYWGPFVFMDSLSHLLSPLADLINTLKVKNSDGTLNLDLTKPKFKFTLAKIRQLGLEDHFAELIDKNIYAYEDDTDPSEYGNEFRGIEKFKSTLNQGFIVKNPTKALFPDSKSQNKLRPLPKVENPNVKIIDGSMETKKYNEAKAVFEKTGMNNSKWDLFYELRDVTALTDILVNHIKTSYETFGLDPLQSLTLPSYGWSSLLYKSEVELEVASTPEEYEFENHPHGGMVLPAIQWRDEKVHKKAIVMFDLHNCYGAPMIEHKLGTGEREIIDPTLYQHLDSNDHIMSLSYADDYNYRLSYDVPEQTPEVQDKHFHLPLFPNQEITSLEELSDHEINILKSQEYTETLQNGTVVNRGGRHDFKPEYKSKVSFKPKTRYTSNLAYVQYAIQSGYKIGKIHSIMRYKQADFAKEFAQTCTDRRIESCKQKDEAGKLLFKTMVVSCFGKMLQNIEHQCKAEFVFSNQFYENELRKQRFIANTSMIEGIDNVQIIEYHKEWSKLKSTRLPGNDILDYSKLYITKFFYEMQKVFPDIELCYMDTDSVVLTLPLDYETTLSQHPELLKLIDFANYPDKHPLYDTSKYMVPGIMENEFPPPNRITEFYCISSKTYYIETAEPDKKGNCHKARAKGIKKSLKDLLTKEDFKDIAIDNATFGCQFNHLVSNNHENQLETVVKKNAINPFDDKYCRLSPTKSCPWGYYKLKDEWKKEYRGEEQPNHL